MNRQKFWIEIGLVGAAIGCTLALFMVNSGAATHSVSASSNSHEQAVPATTAESEQTYEGMISCSRCGAQHPAALNSSATTCVRSCVHGGESFALINSESTYYLLDGDLSVLKTLAGQRARIVGTLTGKTIRVSSAAAGT
jgi:hypothetical protein